ncbi:MAG TPA: glycogen/starch/alpha-glucan phosphorylase, partial [Polyangiaceae bacterium]|nr:glycogen/starch/alpha-glucan phosphorylase [Polyangiaceae bacterium]
RAVADKNASEIISKVLYPNDKTVLGKELRLKQQYFFVRCALVDILRRHRVNHPSLANLTDTAAIQLNDTHPAIAVAELMRILVDEHAMDWGEAWKITKNTIAYTNHTVLAEALETWSIDLIGRLLPRHLQIIFEINRRFLRDVLIRWPNDLSRLTRMSLVAEGEEKRVRMAHLAIVGSHSVNGVAKLHTEILQRRVFKDFFEMEPQQFSAKTNGISPRRWLLQCNPALSNAISQRIGTGWTRDLDQLEKLVPFADDPEFQKQIRTIKRKNKLHLATITKGLTGMSPDPDALFDMQIKRMHEYKRQLLNVLHIVALYLRAKNSPNALSVPRAFFFGGKAAPGYHAAKLIIKLINAVADTIAADYHVRGLSVHFMPNYRVSLAERMIPACDLSEQISTAGMEASGTGNMKLALNGALTIGTLDGANVEIREAVGPDHFFLFGWTAEQVEQSIDGYVPEDMVKSNPELKQVLDLIASGFFCPENRGLFLPLIDSLMVSDPYRILADFQSYLECQLRVEQAYLDSARWTRSCILNIAKMGRFSSDRTVRDYATDIWNLSPVQVKVPRDISSDPT